MSLFKLSIPALVEYLYSHPELLRSGVGVGIV